MPGLRCVVPALPILSASSVVLVHPSSLFELRRDTVSPSRRPRRSPEGEAGPGSATLPEKHRRLVGVLERSGCDVPRRDAGAGGAPGSIGFRWCFFISMFWYSYRGLEPHLQRAHAGHTQTAGHQQSPAMSQRSPTLNREP
jgi:hypothetical protein